MNYESINTEELIEMYDQLTKFINFLEMEQSKKE